MEQRSLRVMETNKTFFSKITNTLTKMLIPTRVGLNNLMITIKRNSLLKVYSEYKLLQNESGIKKENIEKRYEENYVLYLEAIDKYIMDSVYKKVKNNTATAFEREHLSKYYLIVSLKDKNYLEYKYRKQEYLLKIDFESASTIKKQSLLSKYKEFYVDKMDAIYKGLLKNYSISMADNISTQDNVYNNVFTTLEDYTINILPLKIENKLDKELKEEYENYESRLVGKLDEVDIMFKKEALLGICRHIFTHSFPLTAIEKCYIKLIKQAREMIANSSNNLKRNKAYKAFFELVDKYNVKVLSTKVFWTTPKERDEFKKFWDKYSKITKNEDKEILILKYDLKKLDSKKYSKIRAIYKERLVKAGVMKEIINTPKTYLKNYKSKRVNVNG